MRRRVSVRRRAAKVALLNIRIERYFDLAQIDDVSPSTVAHSFQKGSSS